MTEQEQDNQRVLELVAIDKKPSTFVKKKVLESPKQRKRWRNLELPLVAVLCLILVVSTGMILYLRNKPETEINQPRLIEGVIPQTQQSETKGPILFRGPRPAPVPFTHPIEIAAESYPVHPNQTLTIQTKDKSWNGKGVKIYFLEETESSDQEVLYQKVLPVNAQYIGSAVIDQGKWSFQWKAPRQLKSKGYNDFIVIAQSDEGNLSAKRLSTLLYDKLEITPSTVKVGQKVELRGAGFPVGDIRIDVVQKNENDGTTWWDTTIGSVHCYDGSFNFSFEVTPKINGNQITPGIYEVLTVFDFPGTAGESVTVKLNVE